MWLKRLIVSGLSSACSVVDRTPLWRVPVLRRLGCPHGMAMWSSQLDERWHTGVWKEPNDEGS